MELRKRPSNFRDLSVKTSSLHSQNNLWTEIRTKGAHPPRRSYHTTAVHANQMVIFGGQDLREGIVGGLWVLSINDNDLDAEKWEEIKLQGDAPPPLCRHSCVQYQDKMYIFGGTDNNTEYNTLFVLDLNNWRWTSHNPSKPTCPPPIDSHSASLYLDSDQPWIIIFGGFISGSRSNTLFTLNLTTLVWKQAIPCTGLQPCPRSGHSSVVHGHSLIVFGGIDDETNRLNDLWKCDLRTYAWQPVVVDGYIPTGRSGHSAVLYAGVMLVFGGVSDHNRETNDMVSYDFAHNSWVQIQFETMIKDPVSAVQPDEPVGKAGKRPSVKPSAKPEDASPPLRDMQTIVGKKRSIYIGQPNPTFGRIVGNVPHPRDGHSAVVYGEKMIVFGGDRSQMPFNDVYAYSLDETIRRWLTALFHRLDSSSLWYDFDNPRQVAEARFLAQIRDIDRYTSLVGATVGMVIAAILLRKFSLIEGIPGYVAFAFAGREANRYRNHDYMYLAVLRGITKDPEHPS